MANQTAPGLTNVTTTQTATRTVVSPQIRFDKLYIKTIPGILKATVIVLNLLGFICIECSKYSHHSRGEFFNFVAMCGFWFSGLMLIFYIFHVVEKFFRIPWLKIELGFYAVWTLMYLIASCLAVTFYPTAYVVAGFFGFLAMVIYGYETFLKWQLVQSGAIAQGSRTVEQVTTVQSVPTVATITTY
ncbi:CKLF-like MARVEL transmembrane domain-containing protein 4 [Culicoides brevitarsis]|uniref:CKLF-like MARVEL transmembrane domain-containing protein 4 n=1 Tax=Culicoides brevitarsis TaxID=469753 RepID=UPI00307C7132